MPSTPKQITPPTQKAPQGGMNAVGMEVGSDEANEYL